MLSHEDEIEVDKHDVEISHAIIVSNYYEFEHMFSLTTNQEDQLSFSQMELEISEGNPQQLSYLHTGEISSDYEEENM